MAKSQFIQASAFSMTANTDRYRSLSSGMAVATFNTTEVTANVSCQRNLTFSKLFVKITTNSKTLSNPTIKFRNNGADGNMSISIPFGVTGTYSDIVNTDTVTGGNNFCLVYRYGTTGTGTLTTSAISVVADYTGAETITIFQNSTLTTTTAGIRYASMAGYGVNTSTEAQMQLKIPKAGYLKNITVRISANTRNDACSYTLRKNSADTAMTLNIPTLTTGIFRDTTNFISVAADDLVCYKVNLLGASGNVTPYSSHIEYETSTDTFITATEQLSAYAPVAATSYYSYLGGASVTTLSEANSKLDFNLDNYSADSMRVYMITNSVAAISNIYLRKNGVDTALVVSIPASTTGHFSNTVNTVAITNGDDLNYRFLIGLNGSLNVKRVVTAFVKDIPATSYPHRMMLMYF